MTEEKLDEFSKKTNIKENLEKYTYWEGISDVMHELVQKRVHW